MPSIKKQSFVFCLSILLFSVNVKAQSSRVEELLGQLKKTDPDSVQMSVMRKLSGAYSSIDPIKKFYYANQYRIMAEKNGVDSLVSSAYLDMGISYGIRSNLDSALYYFNLGFEKAKASNYEIGIARAYANIGYANDHLGRKAEAVKNNEAALKIFRKLNIKKSINQGITNLGSIYFDMGEYKMADSYFREVLENVKETPNDQMGLANALFSLGNSNRKLGKPEQSLKYFQQSLVIREKLGDINGIALSNWGIAMSYNNKKQYSKALPHLTIALRNNRTIKNIYQECAALITLSQSYMGLKQYDKAEEAANTALSRARQSESPVALSESLENLVEVNKAQKNYATALKFQTDYMAVTDSLYAKEVKKNVILNDLHRVNSDNRKLEKNNRSIRSKISDYINVISIITVLLVAVVILLILYYRRNLEKKSANMLLKEQKKAIADINEELGALNEELIAQMDIVSAQNIELEKLNHVKTKFFSIVSHDLRGPVNNIHTLIGLYRNGDLTEPEWRELLKKLEDAVQNTTTFLDNLLEWSKSQLNGMVVKPSAVGIRAIVDDNIRLMDFQIKLKSLIVENKVASDVRVFADPNMVNIVFRNLLSNAIKFCSSGDEIVFEARIVDDNVICTIRDSGPGISKQDKDNLFNLSHSTSTGSSGEKGYQIGLILCKDMINQNNGSITVSSDLGQGTTFYISLPAVNVAPELSSADH